MPEAQVVNGMEIARLVVGTAERKLASFDAICGFEPALGGPVELNHRTDDQIAGDVRDTLEWDIRIDDGNVAIGVEGGVVNLSGSVGTFAEKMVAFEDAWKLKGVRKVINEVSVRPIGPRLDSDIVADTANALKWDARVDQTGIEVSALRGQVTLAGVVGGVSEKIAAEEDAWATSGVIGVANKLRFSSTRARPDSKIEDDIRGALMRDPRIIEFSRVRVSSALGKVQLRGAVNTREESAAAEELARSTAGVKQVTNEIAVVPLDSLAQNS